MLKPTVVLAATLLCAPVFAQTEQTQPARTLLTQLFQKMKVPFVIGSGIDGDITFSLDSMSSDTPNRIQTILAALPYNTEYRVENNGVHIVRRKPDAPAGNTTSPAISIAAPKAMTSPTLFFSYKDALQWELTRTEIERQRLLSTPTDRSRSDIEANERTMQLLRKRLVEAEFTPIRTGHIATKAINTGPAISYKDAVKLELLHAEMEMAELQASFGPGYPLLKTKQSVLEFLKRRVAELEGKAVQPVRKTAKR